MKKRTKRLLAAILAAAVSITAAPARAAVNSNTGKSQTEITAPVLKDDQAAGQAKTGWDGVTKEDVYEGNNFRTIRKQRVLLKKKQERHLGLPEYTGCLLTSCIRLIVRT